MIKKTSSQKGALARYAIYGNPGTPEGRIRGGLNSIESQKQKGIQSSFVAREINLPQKSNDLAEFVGILLGDGCINENQVSITLNLNDDAEYADYVFCLIEKLFNYQASLIKREKHNAIIILMSRKNIVKFLCNIGLKTGNKIKNQVEVPDWIVENTQFSKFCIKGLMDTDGCLYIDNHVINNKLYRNLGLNFTNRSLPLLHFVRSTWSLLGLNPTQTTSFSIFIRRGKDIEYYMKEIGSSNQKFIKKFEEYKNWKGVGVV